MVTYARIELMPELRVPPKVAKDGTLEGWRAAIDAALAAPNCWHWTLGAAAGFVGPVMSKCGFDTCGINFSGPSSRGKTTAVALGVSPWSSPRLTSGGLLRSMRATENSLELSARQSNNMILGLDELGHADGKMVGRAIYFLSGGVSKARMSAQLTLRPMHSWITFILLSSEKSLAQKVIGDGGQWTGGMAVRFADVDCSAVDARVPRDTLAAVANIYRHYGHVGGPFVGAFKKAELHHEPKTSALRAKILAAAEEIAGKDVDGTRIRSAYPFALILISGGLAREFGFLPETADIEGAVKWGWQRFIDGAGAEALDPEEHALANLRRWVAEHWDTAIKKIGSASHNSRDAAGWYDEQAVYIPVARISEASGAVLSERAIGRQLKQKGCLAHTDKDRSTVRYIPGIGVINAYALKRSEFGRDDPPSFKQDASKAQYSSRYGCD
jgi:hypothetical protein